MSGNVIYLAPPPAPAPGDAGKAAGDGARCLALLLAAPVDAWKGCDRATVGGILGMLRDGTIVMDQARRWLGAAGLGVRKFARVRDAAGASRFCHSAWLRWGEGRPAYLLAVPRSGAALARIFHGTPWQDRSWWPALGALPIASGKEPGVWRIAGKPRRCILLDVERFAGSPRGGGVDADPATPKADFQPVEPEDPGPGVA